MSELDGQVTWFDLGLWSGKTCQEHSVQTEEKTSASSLKKSAKSQTKLPLFLDLRKGGAVQGASWVTDSAWHGEYTMHSFGESPREENASRLSQILEDSAPQKYYLSARACQGILNRAERRGKELPKELKEALENQCRLKGTEQENLIVEPDGGGAGDPSFTLNGVEKHGVAYGIGSYESNAMKSPNPHSGIYRAETARTLDVNGGSPACNQGGLAVVTAVDCRNGTESPDINGTLQAKSQGGYNTNSNNVIRESINP